MKHGDNTHGIATSSEAVMPLFLYLPYGVLGAQPVASGGSCQTGLRNVIPQTPIIWSVK